MTHSSAPPSRSPSASCCSHRILSRFYAGLTRIMSALVFFQVSAIIVIVGAELNRGIVEVKRRLAVAEELNGDVTTVPMPPSHASYRVEH